MRKLWIIVGVIAIFVVILISIRLTQKSTPQKQVIKIGAILPLTGPGAVFAQYIKEGIDLAAEEINQKSRIQLRILYEDSKNQPREGVSAYNKLIMNEKPPVVIVALSSVAKALFPLAEQTNTIQVYIAVAIPGITDGKYRFRIYPEARGMAGVMARYSATRLGAKTAAVIYINDDFGRASLEAFKKEFEAYGGQVVFAESYELMQIDFRSQITKLKTIYPTPDIIYLNGYGPSYGAIVKQLKELRVKSQLTADMTLGLPDTLKQVGDAAEGAYFVDGKMSSDFINKFIQRYRKEPSSYSGYAYDIINILHIIAQHSKSFTPDSIRKGLLNIKGYHGVMGDISIQSNGDSNLEFVVKKIKNGRPELLED